VACDKSGRSLGGMVMQKCTTQLLNKGIKLFIYLFMFIYLFIHLFRLSLLVLERLENNKCLVFFNLISPCLLLMGTLSSVFGGTFMGTFVNFHVHSGHKRNS